jgi:hypothetical protein
MSEKIPDPTGLVKELQNCLMCGSWTTSYLLLAVYRNCRFFYYVKRSAFLYFDCYGFAENKCLFYCLLRHLVQANAKWRLGLQKGGFIPAASDTGKPTMIPPHGTAHFSKCYTDFLIVSHTQKTGCIWNALNFEELIMFCSFHTSS